MGTTFTRRSRVAALAFVLAGSTLLASCATPTPYKAAAGSSSQRTGYWDERIEADRFRVTFAGNSMTSRETVERFLLFRAAQLTLEQGGDYFILSDRDTEKRTSTYINQPFSSGPWGGWGPSWRYYNPRFGWRGWNPWGGDPFWDRQVNVQTIERYEANAEIVIGKGPKPDNIRAFNARDVSDNLGPTITAPTR